MTTARSLHGVKPYDVLQVVDSRGEWADYETIRDNVLEAVSMVKVYPHYRIVGKGIRSHFIVSHVQVRSVDPI